MVEAKPRGLRVAGLSALCIAVIANLVMGATVAFAAVPISRWGGVPGWGSAALPPPPTTSTQTRTIRAGGRVGVVGGPSAERRPRPFSLSDLTPTGMAFSGSGRHLWHAPS